MIRILLFIALSLLPSSVEAGLFKVINRQYGSTPTAIVDAIFDDLEASVNASLPTAEAATYLQGIADSTVISSTQVGADYGSIFDYLLVGVRASLGGDFGSSSLTNSLSGSLNTVSGISGHAAILVGLNGNFFSKGRRGKGAFTWDRFKFFANFFSQSFSVSDFSLGETSLGLSSQYMVVRPVEFLGNWLSWNGLTFTLGAQLTSLDLAMSRSFNTSSTSSNIESGFNGSMTIGADVNIYSIPATLSTGLRLLNLFTLYSGLNIGTSFGSATSIASLTGPITVSGADGVSGEASLDLGNRANPETFNANIFYGLTFNMGAASLYAQLSNSFTDNTQGISAGLNFYW